MPEPIIHTEHLSRSFGTANAANMVKAVNDLSLEVPAGIVFGFLGPNGAGKTTTIHLLLGLLEPTSGQATVLGFDTRAQADEIRARTTALRPGIDPAVRWLPALPGESCRYPEQLTGYTTSLAARLAYWA